MYGDQKASCHGTGFSCCLSQSFCSFTVYVRLADQFVASDPPTMWKLLSDILWLPVWLLYKFWKLKHRTYAFIANTSNKPYTQPSFCIVPYILQYGLDLLGLMSSVNSLNFTDIISSKHSSISFPNWVYLISFLYLIDHSRISSTVSIRRAKGTYLCLILIWKK